MLILLLSRFSLLHVFAGTPHFFSLSGHQKAGDRLPSQVLSDQTSLLPLRLLLLTSRTVSV